MVVFGSILVSFQEIPKPSAGGPCEYYCVITIVLQNQNRRMLTGNVNTECEWWLPSPHTTTWTNLCVNSNLGLRVSGGSQFMGWHPGEGWNCCHQWWPTPNCVYYNYAACTQQFTTHGPCQHASGELWIDTDEDMGCILCRGYVVTSTGNFMCIYDDDGGVGDDFIQRMNFPDLSVTLPNDMGKGGCSSYVYSGWETPSS